MTVEVVEGALRPPSRPTNRRPRPTLAAAATFVAAAATLPAIYLVVRSFSAGASGISEVLIDADVVWLIARTVLLCAAVTATAIAIALPLAWLTVRTDLPGRRTWVVISGLPLVIPSFIGGFAFVAAFGPRGLVQGWLEAFGVERLPSIYGFGGAWLVLSLFTYPLALLPIRSGFLGIDPSLEEAARALGRTRAATFFRITLPQLRPALVSGALLVALYTLSDFGAVSLMRFPSLTFEIFVHYRSSFGSNLALPAVLGLVLVILTAAVLVAEARTRSRAVYHATHRGTRRHRPVTNLGRMRWLAFAACCLLITLALVVPVGVIVVWLARGIRAGSDMSPAVLPALNSLRASFLGGLATLVCAWPVALIAARFRTMLARVTEAASYTGYALPGIVIALSLVFFGARYTPIVYQTMGMLVFAYVVHFLPQATGALRSSISQIHPGIEEAARSLGASPPEIFRKITLPLVRPGALTAFALVFLTVMKELPITLLLSPIGFRTLATQVWDKASAASFGEAAVPALALILLSSLPMSVLVAREQGEQVRRPAHARARLS